MPGQIITFYSYKGGVGRTMALANIAWLLASNGNRVLTIDWDLEAPGLPRFFQPFVDAHLLASTPGLIDLFIDYVDGARRNERAVPSIDGDHSRRNEVDPADYIIPLTWHFPNGGTLHLLPAGKGGPAYGRRVTQFDWEQLYVQFGGSEMVERLKVRFREQYDYVLIDSRTGISDTVGICTVQMPDSLIIFLTLNRQNIEGSARVAESVDAQRRLPASQPVRIFPIPTRLETTEIEKRLSGMRQVSAKFTRFLSHLQGEDNDKVSKYWGAVGIPSIPFYGYEEILCAFGDAPGDKLSMSGSIERIATYVTDGKVTSAPPMESQARSGILAAFSQVDPEPVHQTRCFISHSSRDVTFAEKLHVDLEKAGVRCWFAPHDLPIGAKIRPGLDSAIHANDRVILILSANSISSTWVEKEVETAFEMEAATGRIVLMPLRLDAAIMQAQEGWTADIRRQRNIGDFTGWQENTTYAAALSRLLSALNA